VSPHKILIWHPETLWQCAKLARIVADNQAALALHDAENDMELLAGLSKTFNQELICLWKGFGFCLLTMSLIQSISLLP
jgi:chitinase